MKTSASPSSSYISIACNILLIIPSIRLQAKDIILAHRKRENELVLKLVDSFLDLNYNMVRNVTSGM